MKSDEIAKKQGLDIIFDTNIRMKLWSSEEDARGTISQYLQSKIVFTNEEDNILCLESVIKVHLRRLWEKAPRWL